MVKRHSVQGLLAAIVLALAATPALAAGAEDDWVALSDAAYANDATAMVKLLAAGAKPDVPHQAHITTWSALCVTVIKSELPLADLLLHYGAGINNQDNNGGYTPLMAAANAGHADSVLFLLQHGAKTNLKDHKGATALDWALRQSDSDHQVVAELLKTHGAVKGAGAPPVADDATPAAKP